MINLMIKKLLYIIYIFHVFTTNFNCIRTQQAFDEAVVQTDHLNLLRNGVFSTFENDINILNMVDNQQQPNTNSNTNNNDKLSIIKFLPSVLDFGEQSIGEPMSKNVYIVNQGSDLIKLESISGSTTHFYCSFFKDKIIQPGGNTSFDVYFLAKDVGSTQGILYINTNKGIYKYTVFGNGNSNPYKLKSIINAKINVNSSYVTKIQFHNPYNDTLKINEIYSSDDDLHIELPFSGNNYNNNNNNNNNNNSSDTLNHYNANIWSFSPFESKIIFNVRYMGRHESNHTAFICVKTNNEKKFIILIEMEVKTNTNNNNNNNNNVLASNIFDKIDFGTMSDSTEASTIDVFIGTNSNFQSNEQLYIMDVYSLRTNPAINITYKTIDIPIDSFRLTQIAQITFDPNKSRKSSHNYGKIVISTNNKNASLQIPFEADVVYGQINYNKEKLKYFLPITYSQSSTIVKNSKKSIITEFGEYKTTVTQTTKNTKITKESSTNDNNNSNNNNSNNSNESGVEARDILLFNNHSFNIVVYDVTMGQYAEKYFLITNFSKPTILRPNIDTFVFKLHLIESDIMQKAPIIEDQIYFYTNFTLFSLPVFIYNGLLSLQTVNEPVTIIDEFNFDSIIINTKKEILFSINNSNPIDIYLKKLFCTYENATIEFLYYQALNGTKITLKKRFVDSDIATNLIIPARHKMVLSLTINAFSDCENNIEHQFSFSTKYQNISIPVIFHVVKEKIELINGKLDITSFPSQILSFPIVVRSSFDEKLRINSIEIENFGNVFTFKWLNNNEEQYYINPNVTQKIGIVSFDPELLCKPNCYVGFWPDLTNKRAYASGSSEKDSGAQIKSINLNDDSVNNDKMKKLIIKNAYELWFDTLQSSFDSNNTYYIDKILFDHYRTLWKKYKLLNKNHAIQTQLKLVIDSRNKLGKNINLIHNLYARLKWPLLTTQVKHSKEAVTNVIAFGVTQINAQHTRNISIQNPSNLTVILQIMLIDNYPKAKEMLNLVTDLEVFDSNEEFFDYVDDYDAGNVRNETSYVFSYQIKGANTVNLNDRTLNLKSKSQTKNYSIVHLQPFQQMQIQVNFKPKAKGPYSTLLLIRNNLTVIDAYYVKAEAGTGELRLNNRKPGSTQPLLIEMSEKQFKNCELAKQQDQIFISSSNDKYEGEIKNDISDQIIESLVLRKSFQLKNTGNLDVHITEIKFDDKPCSSHGFDVGYCRDILIKPNETREIDIKYQPDFTMSQIVKNLVFETNLGDITYILHVKIPTHMLTLCHNILPRPQFERYFYYFGICSIALFVIIVVIVALFESRNMLRYHFEAQNHIQTLNNEKNFTLSNFVHQYQVEREYLQTANGVQQQKSGAKISSNSPSITPTPSVTSNDSSQVASSQVKSQNSKSKFLKQLSTNTEPKTNNSSNTTTMTHKALSKSVSAPRSTNTYSSSNSNEKKPLLSKTTDNNNNNNNNNNESYYSSTSTLSMKDDGYKKSSEDLLSGNENDDSSSTTSATNKQSKSNKTTKHEQNDLIKSSKNVEKTKQTISISATITNTTQKQQQQQTNTKSRKESPNKDEITNDSTTVKAKQQQQQQINNKQNQLKQATNSSSSITATTTTTASTPAAPNTTTKKENNKPTQQNNTTTSVVTANQILDEIIAKQKQNKQQQQITNAKQELINKQQQQQTQINNPTIQPYQQQIQQNQTTTTTTRVNSNTNIGGPRLNNGESSFSPYPSKSDNGFPPLSRSVSILSNRSITPSYIYNAAAYDSQLSNTVAYSNSSSPYSRSLTSTPVSDIWLIPNLNSTDKDADYNNMVYQTEEFRHDFYPSVPQSLSSSPNNNNNGNNNNNNNLYLQEKQIPVKTNHQNNNNTNSINNGAYNSIQNTNDDNHQQQQQQPLSPSLLSQSYLNTINQHLIEPPYADQYNRYAATQQYLQQQQQQQQQRPNIGPIQRPNTQLNDQFLIRNQQYQQQFYPQQHQQHQQQQQQQQHGHGRHRSENSNSEVNLSQYLLIGGNNNSWLQNIDDAIGDWPIGHWSNSSDCLVNTGFGGGSGGGGGGDSSAETAPWSSFDRNAPWNSVLLNDLDNFKDNDSLYNSRSNLKRLWSDSNFLNSANNDNELNSNNNNNNHHTENNINDNINGDSSTTTNEHEQTKL